MNLMLLPMTSSFTLASRRRLPLWGLLHSLHPRRTMSSSTPEPASATLSRTSSSQSLSSQDQTNAETLWEPGPTVPTPPELEDEEGLMHKPTAPLPQRPEHAVLYEPMARLVRGKHRIEVRRLYGLPSQTVSREALQGGYGLVQDVLGKTVSLRGRTHLREEDAILDAICLHVSQMHQLLVPVIQESSDEWELSPGFQGVLQEVLANLKLLHQSLVTSDKRRSRKYVNDVVDKLPGLVTHLSIACEIHQLVNKRGNMDPFLPEEYREISTRLSETIANFDADPFFKTHSPNLAPRVSAFYFLLIKATAAASKAYNSHSTFMRIFKFLFYNALYTFSIKRAARQTAWVFRESRFDMRLCKFLWNMPDSQVMRPMFALMYNHVEVDMPFSIPNNIDTPNSEFWTPTETNGDLIQLQQYLKPPRLDRSSQYYHPLIRMRLTSAKRGPLLVASNEHELLQRKKKGAHRAQSPVATDEEVQRGTKKIDEGVNTMDNKDLVQERIMGGLRGYFSLKYPILADPKPALILQMHGGGFVAMTSFSHLPYLRKWAIDTDLPVLSVDYRLAPEYPFPTQLEECYQAYRWIVANSLRLGSTGERVVLAGDSAGGNLAAAVTLRAITEGFRVPDGLLLAYPSLNLNDEPSCSRILSTTDPMLNSGLLLQLQKTLQPVSHLPLENHPFISPSLTPDDALRRFPATCIIAGEFDPLLDDAVLFYKRLRSVNGDVQISIRPGLGHGFMQLVDVAPESQEAVALTSLWLREMCQVDYVRPAYSVDDVTAAPSPASSASTSRSSSMVDLGPSTDAA